MIEKTGICGKWTIYEDKDAPKTLGFKGTSQIGDAILTSEGKRITKEELKEGSKFTEMFGNVYVVKSLTENRALATNENNPECYCSLEYNQEDKCWWWTGYFYCPIAPLEQHPQIIDPQA